MTAVICCIVIGVTLYLCVHDVCETILEVNRKEPLKEEYFSLQKELDDEAQKETVPTFDDVLHNVNRLLGGDDDE